MIMMTMNFDMNTPSLGSAVGNGALSPNKIHEVKFKGIEYAQSKDKKWEFMRMKFNGVEGGYFSDSTFWDEATAGQRKATQFGENPSTYETLLMKIKHLLKAIAPDVLNKMESGEIKFVPKSKSGIFKQYVDFIAELTTPFIDTVTNIKLTANQKGEAQFPAFPISISKEGIPEIKSNFIGNNLSFSAKQLEQMNKIKEAKPSIMPDIPSMDMTMGDTGLESVSTQPEPKDDQKSDILNMTF